MLRINKSRCPWVILFIHSPPPPPPSLSFSMSDLSLRSIAYNLMVIKCMSNTERCPLPSQRLLSLLSETRHLSVINLSYSVGCFTGFCLMLFFEGQRGTGGGGGGGGGQVLCFCPCFHVMYYGAFFLSNDRKKIDSVLLCSMNKTLFCCNFNKF